MAVTAADVKKLREITGAGPLDCKKALEENNGDFALAEKQLKEKGLAALEKRADKATKEGKVFIKMQGSTAAIAEANAETDFVVRNPEFTAMGEAIVDRILEKGYTEIQPDLTEIVSNLAAKIGENMSLSRIKLLKAADNEYITHYTHGGGSIGVVVKLSADKPAVFQLDEVKELAHNLALHIAAFAPLVVAQSDLEPSFIEEQKNLINVQMENDEDMKSKPPAALENILKGKLKKYLSEICLMDQGYVKDDNLTVAQFLAECNKKLDAVLSVKEYVYFKVGQ
jgi:elongation factor Ts